MIDFDSFVQWAESRFGDIKIKGNEIRANSIFHPTKSDTKFRLWMKPSGETKKGERADGVYHCFDTNQKGSLIRLVMLVDKCDYSEACEKIGGGTNLSLLEKKVKEFFNHKSFSMDEVETKLTLPTGCIPLSFKSCNDNVLEACFWLDKRKISPENLFLCTEGKYKNRIIIPYHDADGNLIYFNSRTTKSKKYLGPEKDIGVGKDDVIFVPYWPSAGNKIYVTEGEFDAIVLRQCGLFSAALGSKNLSDKHLVFLKNYKLCFALDNDESGKSGLLKAFEKTKSRGISINYVIPPKNIKDWNDLYLLSDDKVLKAYINRNEKMFSDRDFLNMSL